ncbi:TolC family protein [Cyanobium sp. FGCU-6]|nr:TolC family protein [Cyanobium sp. FGCU6]
MTPALTALPLPLWAQASPAASPAADPAPEPLPPSGAPRVPAPSAPPTGARSEADGLPLAPVTKGDRPRSDPSVLPPAATELPPGLGDLKGPRSLALPNRPAQVRIRELRPLGLTDVETLAEVNNPNLKALAMQVEQAQSNLRAQISLWYPTLDLRGSSFPSYTGGETFGTTGGGSGYNRTITSIWQMQTALEARWALIDPSRTPTIAAARDEFEKAKNQYLIGLRDLRLQAAQIYFDLQRADERVRIGQESVRASLVSLRDARARFQAGVATKLEVLQAETQLSRDQQLLTTNLAEQSVARRTLAALLDLPQDVSPTAKDPSLVVGTWLPSLQESIVAAYAFREELDQALLDISIANSRANAQLAEVQPFLNIVNTLSSGRSFGYQNANVTRAFGQGPITSEEGWNVDNSIGMTFSWRLFDGGRARALYRQQKQAAAENRFRFADRRDTIRREVETSFYELEKNNRNITTTAQEVVSARESLRLARLRFQAGVTTQREVVDTQRDLTQAEVRHTDAIADYNLRLVELRRRTGLDLISLCRRPALPAGKPRVQGVGDVPIEPRPLLPACNADNSQRPSPLAAP